MTSYKIRPVVWPNLLRGTSSGNKSDKFVDKCIRIETDGHFKMNCSGAETGKHTAVPFHLWSTDFDVERPKEIQISVWEWSHIRQASFWRQVGHLLIHGSCVQTFTSHACALHSFHHIASIHNPELAPYSAQHPFHSEMCIFMTFLDNHARYVVITW